jgi:hypothetical protein
VIPACALCGVQGEPWLFALLATVFGLALVGTVVLLVGSVRRGDFRGEEARWAASRAEEEEDRVRTR